MSKSTNKFIAFMALMHSLTALAANELVVFVDSTNVSEESLTAVLDGSTSEAVDGNGFVSLDLVAGQHSLQIKQGGQSLYSFRFTSAAGQLVDIAVILSAGNNPQVTIENYFKTETAGEKKKAQRGGATRSRIAACVRRAASLQASARGRWRSRSWSCATTSTSMSASGSSATTASPSRM